MRQAPCALLGVWDCDWAVALPLGEDCCWPCSGLLVKVETSDYMKSNTAAAGPAHPDWPPNLPPRYAHPGLWEGQVGVAD